MAAAQNYQAFFQRHEKKYLLSMQQYLHLRKDLNTYMKEDNYGLHSISSLYYDTEDFDIIQQCNENLPNYKEEDTDDGWDSVTILDGDFQITSGSDGIQSNNADAAESYKGLKSAADLSINGGTFTLDCADDTVHANGDILINNGESGGCNGTDFRRNYRYYCFR